MNSTIHFTPERTELAALLQGDPNTIHYRENEFGVQVVTGLEQLGHVLSMVQWQPGKTITLDFGQGITAPSEVAAHVNLEGLTLEKKGKVMTQGRIVEGELEQYTSEESVLCRYELSTIGVLDDEIREWEVLRRIPTKQLGKIYSSERLDLIGAVGLAANAVSAGLLFFDWLPDLYVPVLYEGGKNGVLEQRLSLSMKDAPDSINAINIMAHQPRQDEKKKRNYTFRLTADDQDENRIYDLDLHLTVVNKRLLSRSLAHK